MVDPIIIYTDGGASGNPGPGGYGVVMKYRDYVKEFSGGFVRTTNNRMELLGVIVALENLKTYELTVRIYTDSRYVVDAIEKGWLNNWVQKQFNKTKNPDLWKRFLLIYKRIPDVKFVWVKGHAGNVLNERADRLAVAAYNQPNLQVDGGYEHQEDLLF